MRQKINWIQIRVNYIFVFYGHDRFYFGTPSLRRGERERVK